MADSAWPSIHAERRALAEDLADLASAQWSTPSLKLPEDTAATLLQAGGVPFEPMPGRAMGGFFVLPAALPGPEQWVRRSYDDARTLPAKKARAKRA